VPVLLISVYVTDMPESVESLSGNLCCSIDFTNFVRLFAYEQVLKSTVITILETSSDWNSLPWNSITSPTSC